MLRNHGTEARARHSRTQRGDEPNIDHLLLDPTTDPTTLRLGYRLEVADSIEHVDANGAPAESIHRIQLRRLSSKSRFFVTRYGYEEDRRRGVVTVEPDTGCELVKLDESEDGVVQCVFDFEGAAITETGACDFSFKLAIDSERPMIPRFEGCARSRILRISKRVHFTAPALPEKIWWFRDQSSLQMEPESSQILPISRSGQYYKEFSDVEDECVGIAWRGSAWQT